MLIKTEAFDRDLKSKLSQLRFVKNRDLIERGSYRIKPFGSIVTDYDIAQYIRINRELFLDMANTIKNLKDFIFLGIYCGTYDEFVVPWVIDGEGGCFYDPKKTMEWLENISKLVPQELSKEIYAKLFGESLGLQDLISARAMTREYSEIVWKTPDEIINGKIFNGKKYTLENEMKKGRNCMARFVFLYQNDVIQVELSVIDDRFLKNPFIIHEHYGRNLYKVFKSLKWYLPENVKKEYAKELNSMEWFPAVLDRLKIIDQIDDKKITEKVRLDIEKNLKEKGYDVTIKDAKKVLTKELYDRSQLLIKKYTPLIDPNYKDEVEFYFLRAKQSISTPQKVIRDRCAKGIKCPFFDIQIDDFNFLWNLADRALLSREKIMYCVTELSKAYDMDAGLFIRRFFAENSFELQPQTKNGQKGVWFLDAEKHWNNKWYPIEKLPELQRTVLFSLIT
jgi:hypothetical protein